MLCSYRLSGWRQYFSSEKFDQKYEKLDDDNDTNESAKAITYVQLFRSADWLDILMLVVGLLVIMLYSIAFTARFVLFGQITGAFITQSFIDQCSLKNNLTAIHDSNRECLLNRSQISRNHDQSQQLCPGENTTVVSPWSFSHAPFRAAVTSRLPWLILIGVVELVCIISQYFIFNMTARRQAARIRILLLRSVMQRLTAKESKNELDMYSQAGEIVQEVFSSIRTVISLNGGKFEEKRYEKKLQATHWSSVRKGSVFGLLTGWVYLIAYIIYALGFSCGLFIMHDEGRKKFSFSDLFVIVVALARIVSYVAFVSPFFQSLEESRGALAPVFLLIDEETKRSINEARILDDASTDDEDIDMNGDIQFENVSFAYPTRSDVLALQDLTLTARAGEITALVGSNGSGGIHDRSITECNLKQLRQKIGVVNQEPILFDTTIYENIRLCKTNATRVEIETAARQANAHDFIMQLPDKYETIVGERGIQLSGGEKQRVALARALIKQPPVLLLDEATSALDGRTTIVIAHRLATIQNAQRIYVLANGRVIEQGTHETLMAQKESRYCELMKAQQSERKDIDIDDTTDTAQMDDDNQKKISEHVRYHNGSEIEEEDKASLVKNHQPVLWRLLLMNSPELVIIIIGCVSCLITGVSQSIYVVLLAEAITAFSSCTYEERRHLIVRLSIIFVVMGVVLLFIRFIQHAAFAISGSKLTERIRLKAFGHLLRQEMAFFDFPENSSGAICNRLSSDALAVQQIVGARLGIVCEAIATFGFGIILGMYFSWQLTLVVLVYILFLFFLAFVQICWQARLKKRSDAILGPASSLAVQIIHNMRTVKHLASETEFLRQFSYLVLKEFRMRRNDTMINSLLYGINWGTVSFILVALYWLGLDLVEEKQLKITNVAIVFAYYIFILESLRMREMSDSLSAAQSFFNLFDRVSAIDNSSTDGQQLSDFQGQRVALIGASGCGKSTVIQLLERFYDPLKGKILFDDVDIRELNIQWLRSCLGLVSQEPILFDLTIAENIAYGHENASMKEIIEAATKANIHDFIQQLPQGYETKVGMKGGHLSGGEKQRVAIARILYRRPKVLLLDEATSALDSYNEQIVQDALDKAQIDDPTRTSLIIAHRLSTIRSCDLICVLNKGNLIEMGTHTDLMEQRGAYYNMIVQNSTT
ncbi:unnamed protein product [Rotaria magnacalcarata]|uniref:Uncharacterized protein n=6 Tax=Rotaria magnacalcarata TaxID=392030 RepID=A0A819WJA7_9BILA|nr:unnamed protein product [Rotaria magnacalcarata]